MSAEQIAELTEDLKRAKARERHATQHAFNADAREADANAARARAEARLEAERAAHLHVSARRYRAETAIREVYAWFIESHPGLSSSELNALSAILKPVIAQMNREAE